MNTYMLQELQETTKVIDKILVLNNDVFDSIKNRMKSSSVILTGMGSSFFISEIGEYFFKNINLLENIFSSSADELREKYPFISEKYSIFTFSQSGKTVEVLNLLKTNKHIYKYSFTSNQLGEHLLFSDNNHIFDIGLEKSPVSTKYVIHSILFLYRLALHYSENFNLDDIIKLKESCSIVFTKYEDKLYNLTNLYKDGDHFIIIGNGLYNTISKEVSLKIRETTGITATYENTGQLNHGGINSIKNNSLCILLENDDVLIKKIKERGGKTITMGYNSNVDIKYDGINKYIDSIQSLILLYFFIHILASKLNINTDKKPW